MKIVLFISSLSGGGAERVTCNLANYLYDQGNDVTVITMSDVKDTYIINDKINRYYLLKKNEKSNFIKNNYLRYIRLKQFLINNKDVNCYLTMLPIPSFMLMSLKKHTNAKLIYAERNNPKSYPLFKQCMIKYVEKKCDGLIVQTNEIGNYYHLVNKTVIPNAINISVLCSNQRGNIQKKIVSVGRLEKQKNYSMLIKGFSIFLKTHPDYVLEIYGQGSLEKKLKSMASKLNILDKIYFKGYVKNISENIYNARMFVMTSTFEGMPNALIEAMCLGIPCISTDCDGGGARDIIYNEINGILIKKGDVNALVNSMKRIACDDEFSDKLSCNAKKLNKTLEYDTIYGKWQKFIKNTINGKVNKNAKKD